MRDNCREQVCLRELCFVWYFRERECVFFQVSLVFWNNNLLSYFKKEKRLLEKKWKISLKLKGIDQKKERGKSEVFKEKI